MSTPIETIADALVAFIMSLLHDADAAGGFAAAPHATLAQNGLGDVCMADVNAVRPVIIDHPTVVHHVNPPPPPADPGNDMVAREIVRMIQQYTTIDARSTILDQSVNQNIWTEGGDVTQLFDQDAVVASGDDAVAAGHDISVTDSDVDVSMGDVSIGNETNDGSFNQVGTDDESDAAAADAAAADAPVNADAPQTPDADIAAAATATGQAVDTAVDAAASAAEPAAPASAPADVPEPADLLEGDMTSEGGDSYDPDAANPALDDQPLDAPLEDD